MEAAHPAIGTVVAKKYRVDSVLGSGGMGVVLAATHLQLREQVALKLLRSETCTRPDSVARFLREARVAMKMRGEHVVRVLDVGTLDDGAPFIAMECLKGEDLSAVLNAQGPLPPSTAVDYVLQACEAIAEAHALGVIHRDLKPANLFLTTRVDGSPCIKVLDFGVSKIAGDLQGGVDPLANTLDDTAEPASVRAKPDSRRRVHMVLRDGVTATRAILGSPRYMAPEQLRSPRDVDVRADVWALGAILFELAAGEPPFSGDTIEELRAAIGASPPRAIPGAPPRFDEAVQACLAKNPEERCPSVVDLVELLAPFSTPEGAESVRRVRRMGGSASLPPPAVAQSVGGVVAAPPTHDAIVQGVRRPIRRVAVAVVTAAIGVGAVVATIRVRRDVPAVVAVPSSVTPGPTQALPTQALPTQAPSLAPSEMPAAASPELPARASAPPGLASATPSPRPHAPRSEGKRVAPAASATVQEVAPDPLKLDAGFLFEGQK